MINELTVPARGTSKIERIGRAPLVIELRANWGESCGGVSRTSVRDAEGEMYVIIEMNLR